eukprot:6728451-Pyramimonas_sp.AAC.1
MWLAPSRRARSLHGSRAAPFQHVVLALAPRIFLLNGCQGATVMLSRGAEVQGIAFWRDSGSPRRNGE